MLEVKADVEPIRVEHLRARSLGADHTHSLDREWTGEEIMLLESLERRRASDNEITVSPARRRSSMKQPTVLFPEAVEVVSEDGKLN